MISSTPEVETQTKTSIEQHSSLQSHEIKQSLYGMKSQIHEQIHIWQCMVTPLVGDLKPCIVVGTFPSPLRWIHFGEMTTFSSVLQFTGVAIFEIWYPFKRFDRPHNLIHVSPSRCRVADAQLDLLVRTYQAVIKNVFSLVPLSSRIKHLAGDHDGGIAVR